MAFEKFSTSAANKTHGVVEASLVDVLLPHVELVGGLANMTRSAAYTGAGYLLAKKKITGNFF